MGKGLLPLLLLLASGNAALPLGNGAFMGDGAVGNGAFVGDDAFVGNRSLDSGALGDVAFGEGALGGGAFGEGELGEGADRRVRLRSPAGYLSA